VKITKLLLVMIVSLVVAACGGGGSSPAPTNTVISGVVFDDAVSGATVTATSLSSGQVLGSAVTGADGSFTLSIPTLQIGSGYSLASTGGTMNGLPFNGNLLAIYAPTANPQQANLTLLTSALSQAANNTTLYSGTVLQKQNAIVANGISRGIITADYFLVAPSGSSAALLGTMQNLTQSSSVLAAVQNVAAIINARPTPGGCGATDDYCNFEVDSQGKSFTNTFLGAVVSAPAGTLKDCLVIAKIDIVNQSMTMRLERISSIPIKPCAISGNVSLTLPSFTAEAPSACLPQSDLATNTQSCVTVGSGIAPNYLVHSSDGYHHLTDKNPHISTPVFGGTTTFSRNYGAVLYSSHIPSSKLAKDQWIGKTPVIFVHGFTLDPSGNISDGFGGNDGTWGNLPQLVLSDPNIVALNFQWRTDQSYLAVADALAKAVDYAYISTGNKVHIVAHSFGGVLSRAMLQNLNGATANSAANVATLTTIGTPHSGIVKGGSLQVQPEGITLPEGWGSWIPNGKCGQISCYQSGLDANIAPWAKNELACPVSISGCVGPAPMHGYVNARLSNFAKYYFPLGLNVNVLIGQIVNTSRVRGVYTSGSDTFSADDGLISYHGQRFIPQSTPELLLHSLQGRATVTERILGLPATINALPGTSAFNKLSPYSYSGGTSKPIEPPLSYGYKHNEYARATGLETAHNNEVNIPLSCGTAATCKHDTWLNIKEFLQANVSPVAPSGINATAGDGQAIISWNAVSGATGYKIYRDGVLIASPTTLAYSDTGLTPSTQYCYTVSAFDAAGNESAQSSQQCVVTLAITTPTSTYTLDVSTIGFGSVSISPPGSPRPCGVAWLGCIGSFYGSGSIVTLNPVLATGSIFAGWSGGGCSGTGSCTVTMNTNESITAIFSTPSTFSCNACIIGTGPTTALYNHTVVNASMIPCTICHGSGSAAPPPPATAPTVQSLAATFIMPTSVQMNALVNPNGSLTLAYFEFGTTTSYGYTTGLGGNFGGTSDSPITFSMSGLSPSTTYHYRAVASNTGGAGVGGDVSFTTLVAAPLPPPLPALLSETEPNDSSLTANALPLLQPYTGKISTSTDVDWWSVQVNSGQLLTFILNSPLSANYDLQVYGSTSTNPTIHLICMNNSGNGICDGTRTGAGGTEYVSFTTSVSGTFYARILGAGGEFSATENYTLQRTD
jgi:pimeloyl-ACP methyl ester carboxylesterase